MLVFGLDTLKEVCYFEKAAWESMKMDKILLKKIQQINDKFLVFHQLLLEFIRYFNNDWNHC